ncbi:16S rRNA (adenine(1518)-N(6)/adenine(1519)-N(6))-dimethyltransferase RsmA [Limisalsivibrio acetivorans]|uniref:16S rRNA (adenine(1518)-N(6)/adenine(1519)-N(6))- dimethyltransferase RsmA n=1 Tax=Limisalsivibrio acetivorans TaxID=1304888 RepID=UPI0003B3DF11|nr:16S rRNA (adenine(1518)-N(6)/adenine(1519)-N(6))-dimethyltransferase RsmA [Limisalsivibrio acetivorans]
MLDLLSIFKSEAGRTKKYFGQHFLTNPHILELIAESAGVGKGSNVMEIGPGCGVLTHRFLERGASVQAVEIDGDLASFLKRYLHIYPGFSVINEDFLKADLSLIEGEDLIIAGNLPYNVSVDITVRCTDLHSRTKSMVFMYQKEVADRINAKPKTRNYSSITVLTDYYYTKKKVRDISGGQFWPNTKVTSTILLFTPRERQLEDSETEQRFLTFVRTCFQKKRKTLRNNMAAHGNASELIRRAGFKESIRAEEMELEDFIKLFRIINENNEI